jgi:hypothetical protein
VISTGAAEAVDVGSTSAPTTAKTATIFTFRILLNIKPPGFVCPLGTFPELLLILAMRALLSSFLFIPYARV